MTFSVHEAQYLAYWMHVSKESLDSIGHHRMAPIGAIAAKSSISVGILPTTTTSISLKLFSIPFCRVSNNWLWSFTELKYGIGKRIETLEESS